MTHPNTVIFSVDDQSPLGLQQFIGWMSGQYMTGKLIPLVGSWEGVQEHSFMVMEDDFHRIVIGTHWVEDQDCFMYVDGSNKQYVTLEYFDGTPKGIGSLKCVSQEEALNQDGWIYRPDTDQWFIVVDGNPDTVPEDTQVFKLQQENANLKEKVKRLERLLLEHEQGTTDLVPVPEYDYWGAR